MKTTNCENCGIEFSYRYKGKVRRFCSTNCAYPDRFLKKYEAPCPICGDTFLKVESNNKNLRKLTCGKQKCQKSRANHPNYSNKVEVECNGCGVKFLKSSRAFHRHLLDGYKHHYCSFKCLKQSANLNRCWNNKSDSHELLRCIKCDQEKKRSEFRPNKNVCINCFYAYQKQRWLNRKLWAIEYLGGCCKDCGGIKHWTAYDFHHRDPNEKEYEWSKMKLRSKKALVEELDKCDLVCSCCHRLRHFLISQEKAASH